MIQGDEPHAPQASGSAASIEAVAPPSPVGFGEALRFWLKLGFVSFGGSAGQIAIMHAELVERRRWISEKRFLHALNYCMVLPGPEAQQLATYIGWLLHRTPGGLAAGGLFVLPSLFILIALSWIYVRFGNLPVVAGLFFGLKPAVTALVLYAGYRISTRSLRNGWLWAIAAASLVATLVGGVPFPAIVIVAAALGALAAKRWPRVFVLGAQHGEPDRHYGPALIDDDTPPPAHARFSRSHAVRVVLLGVALWGTSYAALASVFGLDSILAAMGWFFTKAALVTFGGAYAVLPYVYQGAVEAELWLSGPQMIDGLALGETTPGPLIMVVAFVGFVGAWFHALPGADPFTSALLGATVATFFTFLPSFVFIFAGGPLVEATHGKLAFTAPLTAITAAVVGVIVNLALFFARHVLWPEGFAGGLDWAAGLIAAAAALALFRFRVGVLPLLAFCAAAGLLATWVR